MSETERLEVTEEMLADIGGTSADIGPGCCHFVVKNGNEYAISKCGTRALCDKIVADFRGQLISYTPGQDCIL